MEELGFLTSSTQDVSVAALLFTQGEDLYTSLTVTFEQTPAGSVQGSYHITSYHELHGAVKARFLTGLGVAIAASLGGLAWSLHRCRSEPGFEVHFEILSRAALAGFSIVLLVAAMDATGCFSFEELSAQIIGKRTGHLVELCIIIFQYGTLVAYTIAVGDVLSPLLALDAVRDAAPWLTRDLVMVFFWALFMLPLSFVTAISSLQITSLFGQLSLLYLVLAVAVHSALDVAAAPDAELATGEVGAAFMGCAAGWPWMP